MDPMLCYIVARALQPRPGLIDQTFTAATSALYAADAMLGLLAEPGVLGTGCSCSALSACGTVLLLYTVLSGPYQRALWLWRMLAYTWKDGSKSYITGSPRFFCPRFDPLCGRGSTYAFAYVTTAAMNDGDIEAVLSIMQHYCEEVS